MMGRFADAITEQSQASWKIAAGSAANPHAQHAADDTRVIEALWS